jgi:uncharacterized protein YkwD
VSIGGRALLDRRLLGVLLVSAALVAGQAGRADADARPVEKRFARMVNGTRAANLVSLPALKVDDRLSDIARRHTKKMVAQGQLFHSDLNRILRSTISSAGENVGMAGSLEEMLAAFMASPPHAQNILGRYTRTGVGMVRADGRIWVTQIFAA